MADNNNPEYLMQEILTFNDPSPSNKKYNKYEIMERLGQGAFSICYKIKCVEGEANKRGKIFAAKEIKEYNDNKKLIDNEISLYENLSNKNIVEFHGYFIEKEKQKLYILLDFCENNDLKRLLNKRKKLKEIEVIYYISQLIEALRYLHKKKIIHRDIKLENIFLTKNMELKLGDFGLAKKLTITGKVKEMGGTPPYMAPEIIKGNDYSFGVDVWAIGIIMYYLIIGKLPFKDKDEDRLKEKIIKAEIKYPEDAIISNVAKDLIRQILVVEPKQRPSLDQILIHDFFHLGNSIPRLLPKKFMEKSPSLEYIRNFLEDADINGIVKRGVIHKRLIEIKLDEENNSDKKNNVYVRKCIINYVNKYGLGYQLSNNNYGVSFRDSSFIVFNNERNEYFYKESKDEKPTYFKKDDIDKENEKKSGIKLSHKFFKKIELVDLFKRALSYKDLSSNSTISEINGGNDDESDEDWSNPTYIKKFYIFEDNSALLRLNNKNIQIYLSRGESILLSKEQKEVTFINKNKDKLETLVYSIKDVTETQNHDVIKKLQYAKYLLERIIDEDKS